LLHWRGYGLPKCLRRRAREYPSILAPGSRLDDRRTGRAQDQPRCDHPDRNGTRRSTHRAGAARTQSPPATQPTRSPTEARDQLAQGSYHAHYRCSCAAASTAEAPSLSLCISSRALSTARPSRSPARVKGCLALSRAALAIADAARVFSTTPPETSLARPASSVALSLTALAALLARSDKRVAVCCPHSLVLFTAALAAVPISFAALATESAALAIAAREVRLLASISQAMPIPIRTRGIGFSRTSRPRLRR